MPPSSFWATDPSPFARPPGPLRLPPVPDTTPARRPGASPTSALPGKTGPPGRRIPAAIQRPRSIPEYAYRRDSTKPKQRLRHALPARKWTIAGVVQYLEKLTCLGPLRSRAR